MVHDGLLKELVGLGEGDEWEVFGVGEAFMSAMQSFKVFYYYYFLFFSFLFFSFIIYFFIDLFIF